METVIALPIAAPAIPRNELPLAGSVKSIVGGDHNKISYVATA